MLTTATQGGSDGQPTTYTTGWPADQTGWDDWSAPATTSTPAWADPTTTWAAWTTPSPTTSQWDPATTGWSQWSGGNGNAPIAPVGNTWAIAYSPFTADSGCRDEGTINWDMSQIAAKGFSAVRIYSTQCNMLEYVGNACRQYGLKMILGVYIDSNGISAAQSQVTDITSWAQWDLVQLLIVGNEAVFNGWCSASALAGFIGSAKQACRSAGYTGPVGTTEPLSTWQESGTEFCSVVDVNSANLYAYFNTQTTPEQAGPFIQQEIDILAKICPGKPTYVMESGWPNAGDCNGAACPGPSQQEIAIKSIQSTCGSQVVFFSYSNDAWKQPGPLDVEQHWGCINVF